MKKVPLWHALPLSGAAMSVLEVHGSAEGWDTATQSFTLVSPARVESELPHLVLPMQSCRYLAKFLIHFERKPLLLSFLRAFTRSHGLSHRVLMVLQNFQYPGLSFPLSSRKGKEICSVLF